MCLPELLNLIFVPPPVNFNFLHLQNVKIAFNLRPRII